MHIKYILLNWIKDNQFCYGINWLSGMEVSIRAINWILAVNILGREFFYDSFFYNKLLISLVQHAEYISTFPEVGSLGYTNNHATASFVGLLFLALSLNLSKARIISE